MKQDNELLLLLRKKSEQVRNAANILTDQTNDWQLIKAYLSNRIGDFELSAIQQQKLERYQFIYNQLVGGRYTKQEIINQAMKLQDGISLRHAYLDFNNAQEIFSSVINIKKQFELTIELESARNLKRKCEEMQDFKTAAAIQKNIIAIISMLPDEEEDQTAAFEGIEMTVTFDPRLLGAPPVNMKEVLDAINAKRAVKIRTDMFQEIIPDDSKNTAL